MAAFWKCLTGQPTDIGLYTSADQLRGRISEQFKLLGEDYADKVTRDCRPLLTSSRKAIKALSRVPDVLTAAQAQYLEAVDDLDRGISPLASGLATAAQDKRVAAWLASRGPTDEKPGLDPEYLDFLACAVPEWKSHPDRRALLVHLHAKCFKQNPVSFVEQIRVPVWTSVGNVHRSGGHGF